jgi:aerobic-type carbon monoxide dehydrogenase small subunit (CoxS/CutS family)
MATTTLNVNGKDYVVDVSPDTPLLWVLRDNLGLTGTKYGCGEGLCGACTVHLDAEPTRSCTLPVSEAAGKKITTIEGLASGRNQALHKAWLDEEVSQCGYCQPGILMVAAALMAKKSNPTDPEIDEALDGNLCRCGTYGRVRRAIHRAATNGGGAK